MMDFNSNRISVPFRWSGGVWTITIVFVLVLVGVNFRLGSLAWPVEVLWLRYLLIVVFLAAVIMVFGYMPMRLEANNEKIIVKRLLGSLQIPRSEIIEIRRISKSDISNSIRTFGSGGAGGYCGRFRNNGLGRYTMYATELNNLIFIRTNGNKKYVFSCSCPQEFVEYVKQG